jgi:hypothetical protein
MLARAKLDMEFGKFRPYAQYFRFVIGRSLVQILAHMPGITAEMLWFSSAPPGKYRTIN